MYREPIDTGFSLNSYSEDAADKLEVGAEALRDEAAELFKRADQMEEQAEEIRGDVE